MAIARELRISLAARGVAFASALVALAIALTLALTYLLPDSPWLVASVSLLIMLLIVIGVVRGQLRSMLSLFRALTGTVTSYRDGDFSFGLNWPRNDELGDLVSAHNALGEEADATLRAAFGTVAPELEVEIVAMTDTRSMLGG